MRIQTITSLSLTESWRGVKTHEVVQRQGDLDGACGPYALMNALMLSRALKEPRVRQLWDLAADARTVLGQWARARGALVSGGTNKDHLRDLLSRVAQQAGLRVTPVLTPIALTGRKEGKLLGGLCAVQEWMDLHENREPVLGILQFDKSQLHWVVIVGSQYHQRDEKYVLSNLLVVDSGEVSSRAQAWNGVLGLGHQNARRLLYTVPSSEDPLPCDLIAAFGLVAY